MPESGAQYRPKALEEILAGDVRKQFKRLVDAGDRWLEGLSITWTGTTLHVAVGKTYINGNLQEFNSQVNESLASGDATYYVFVEDDADIIVNTSGVPPANSIKIWEVVVAGGVITGTTDFRDDTVNLPVPLSADGLDAQGAEVTSVGTAVENDSAPPLSQVNSLIAAKVVPIKVVRVASTANLTLSGPQTIDGVSVIAGERVLVKDQSTPSQNGIYDVAAGAWVRSSDSDASAEMSPGELVSVAEGTVAADKVFTLATEAPITLGTTSLSYTEVGVKGHAATTSSGIHGSTAAATINTLVHRNGTGQASFADPVNADHAATKGYVDAFEQGLDVKKSVRAATTAAGTLATSFENGDTIDGVVLATGNRILIKDQAAAEENGIYVVQASGAPVRATDADTSAEVTAGLYTFVEEGAINADTGWVLTTNDPITLGTTGLTFTQFSGVGSFTAGSGLTLTGTQFSVNQGFAFGWTALHTWSLSTASTAFAAGEEAVRLATTATALANTSHKNSPFIALRASIWTGASAAAKDFQAQVVGVSGTNSAYGFRLDSSDLTNLVFIRGDRTHVGIGTATPDVSEGGSGFTVVTVHSASNYPLFELSSGRADADGVTLASYRAVWPTAQASPSHRVMGAIELKSAGTTANQRGSRWVFYTKKDADTNTNDVVYFLETGSILLAFGQGTSVSRTGGFVYLPTTAGTPTGTPTAFTNMVPFAYDTTNDVLYAYNASWKGVGQSTFDKMAARAAADWVSEGPVEYWFETNTGSQTNGRTSEARFYSSSYSGYFFGKASNGSFQFNVPRTDSTAWTDGDKLEFVATIELSAFANLGANQLAGVTVSTDPSSGYNKTGATLHRITVGVDSAGDIFVVTTNGSSATATDTGVNYTAGTRIRVKIIFTKGTDVSVTIDGNSPTVVSSTLPTHIRGHGIGIGSGTSTDPIIRSYGGWWSIST